MLQHLIDKSEMENISTKLARKVIIVLQNCVCSISSHWLMKETYPVTVVLDTRVQVIHNAFINFVLKAKLYNNLQ